MRLYLILIPAILLVSCSTQPVTPLVTSSGGCNPQVLSVSEVPVGVLEVRVVDGAGVPQAGVTVMAYRDVYTGAKCPSNIDGTTDAQGIVKFDRLKTGPFVVRIPGEPSESIRIEVKANETATVTLVRSVTPSPLPSSGT